MKRPPPMSPCLWTYGGMTAQATPLLLLLLWLLMVSQGQVIHVKHQEGQTLRVSCNYSPQIAEERWKTWCKLREDGKVCDRLITRKSVLAWLLKDPRTTLEDDTYSGTITITMSKLRVNDSGNYWCGIYDSVHSTIDAMGTIRLEVSPGQKVSPPKYSQTTAEMPTTNLVTPVTISSYPVIQVLYGLIVTKGLVFTALLVLLDRCRGPAVGGQATLRLKLRAHVGLGSAPSGLQ
ncbi:natural cytotoxicity triggering receptor 2-like [Petaurus breviceps papuanus]|uniref:natural cytotoxicity triggering receptor 2-like n=1 Tax=Petaurus breviceps papuanus TaxID=3040969 RepID=UPI0036DEEEF6